MALCLAFSDVPFVVRFQTCRWIGIVFSGVPSVCTSLLFSNPRSGCSSFVILMGVISWPWLFAGVMYTPFSLRGSDVF
jgi:hypothetical protein